MVELPEDQLAALARYCEQAGITQAEAIQRAVDKLTTENQPGGTPEEMQAAFGLWRDRPGNSREYVESLRSEWDAHETNTMGPRRQ